MMARAMLMREAMRTHECECDGEDAREEGAAAARRSAPLEQALRGVARWRRRAGPERRDNKVCKSIGKF